MIGLLAIPKQAWNLLVALGKTMGEWIGGGIKEVFLNIVNWMIEQINKIPFIDVDTVSGDGGGRRLSSPLHPDRFLSGPSGTGLPSGSQPIQLTVKIGDETVEHVVTKALGNSVLFESGIAGLDYSSA